MQRAFVNVGAPMEVPLARGIVPNINRIAAALRAAGGPVFWVGTTLTDRSGVHPWTVYHTNFFTPEGAARHLAAVSEGGEWHPFHEGLDIRTEDTVVYKDRFSALIQGASPLDGQLREADIDTVIVVGTLTNKCCESTARDAMMLGYKVVFPEDANATLTDAAQLASLINVAESFGDVRTSDEVLGLLGAGN
jgi:ureidoacrylate peracid hydrolase